ncbi:MAG: ribonuclease III [Halobacteriovoraceae bacterium]|nr:ribonuclease III [Halobacteriovoraceae bacterium]|tara:strand:+ start:37775 stop:38572 length:798 start_codon:yes stop_codon:yes gene_type:complete
MTLERNVIGSQISKNIFDELIPLNPKNKVREIQNFVAKTVADNSDLPELDSHILTQALTHKSFAHEVSHELENNEVLEFLGDAVLDLIVSEKLMELYPNVSEGKLSKLRSSIVNEKSLTTFSEALKLGQFLLVGKGELKSDGHMKSSLLSNAFEAVIGAIYKNKGLEAARSFFYETVDKADQDTWSLESLESFDAKTRLQEMVMKKYQTLPEYKSESVDDEFKIKCFIRNQEIAQVTHSSKKKGMQELAQKILNENLLDTLEKEC